MTRITARHFELPAQGEVIIEARRNGDVRVSDPEEHNVQTITREQTDEAARTILSLGEGESVPVALARRLAFARLAQDAAFISIPELAGRFDMPAAGQGASATPPSSVSPLSQAKNPDEQRVAGCSANAKEKV